MRHTAAKLDDMQTYFGGAISAVYMNLHDKADLKEVCNQPSNDTTVCQAELSLWPYMAARHRHTYDKTHAQWSPKPTPMPQQMRPTNSIAMLFNAAACTPARNLVTTGALHNMHLQGWGRRFQTVRAQITRKVMGRRSLTTSHSRVQANRSTDLNHAASDVGCAGNYH